MSLSKVDRYSYEGSRRRISYGKERFIRFFGSNQLYSPCDTCIGKPEQCYVFRDGPCAAKCSSCMGLSQSCSHTEIIDAWRRNVKNYGWEEVGEEKINCLKFKWSKLQHDDPILSYIPSHLKDPSRFADSKSSIIPKKRSLEDCWETSFDSQSSTLAAVTTPSSRMLESDDVSIKSILIDIKKELKEVKEDMRNIKRALGI